jgi:hypothetical protein
MSNGLEDSAIVTELIASRQAVYGDPVNTFTRMAAMWSAIIDHEIQPWEVPMMMIAMKMIRTTQAPDYSDNSDDVEGYLDIFRTLIGEDMVHARSVSEYVEKKFAVSMPDLEYGTCDNCLRTYSLSSRDGRCGDCGNCDNCCIHLPSR